jgi:hypothetical protein
MPTELVFSTGASVKVTAGIQELADALAQNRDTFETSRFAGFRGEDAVAGERVVVNVAAVSYAIEIPGP